MDEADYYVHQIHVKNEFAEGESCMEAYRCVYEANRRICERLGVDEDSDVELIIDSMFDITHIVAEKMLDACDRGGPADLYFAGADAAGGIQNRRI